MHTKSLQLCLTLCDPMDYIAQIPLSMGILQARILEWVAMPSSRGSFYPGIKPMTPALVGRFFFFFFFGRQVLYH